MGGTCRPAGVPTIYVLGGFKKALRGNFSAELSKPHSTACYVKDSVNFVLGIELQLHYVKNYVFICFRIGTHQSEIVANSIPKPFFYVTEMRFSKKILPKLFFHVII